MTDKNLDCSSSSEFVGPVRDVQQWLNAYEKHLLNVRGLRLNSVRVYVRIAAKLTNRIESGGKVDWRTLNADWLAEFVLSETKDRRGKGVGAVTCGVRSFLRYLVSESATRAGLELAIPKLRTYSHTGIPQHLNKKEIKQLLKSTNDGTAMGLRNFAVLLLLSKFGLRGAEVAGLELGDIDWVNGFILIRTSKTHQERKMPLTQDVATALLNYLKQGRPSTTSRGIFLRHLSPYLPLHPSSISKIVGRRILKSGIRSQTCGSHILRHSVATQLVNNGASFKDIADLLGHRTIESTAIYAKVDLASFVGHWSSLARRESEMTDSILKKKMQEYISLRNALGTPLGERDRTLRDFVEYLERRCDGGPIEAHMSSDWACLHASRHSVMTQRLRLILARGFLRHLKAAMPEIEIPSLRSIAKSRRSNPYVFTTSDLNRLMRKAGSKRRPENSIHPFTLQTIIGLMSCSGLRPGEVVRLNVTDVSIDHDPPRLLIRSSKFKKSRWVPLHFTAYNRLIEYLEWRQKVDCVDGTEPLFVCKKDRRLTYQKLRQNFAELIQQMNLPAKEGLLRPTLHSLRHTFAVCRLRQWYAWKRDTRVLLPILSVYLGHRRLQSSYWYLSATPELMNAASKSFEDYVGNGGVQ